MDPAAVAVVGTLLGGLLGALTSYVIQAAMYKRGASERLQVLRRQIYVDWLTHVHEYFSVVRAASLRHRVQSTAPKDLIDDLRRIPAEPAQIALEHLRLTAGEEVAASAARLWAHLRRELVPLGADRSRQGYRTWSSRYWVLRRTFLDAARVELSLEPFDWDKVGAGRQAPEEEELDRQWSRP